MIKVDLTKEDKDIIRDFIEATPKWLHAFQKMHYKQCPLCGILPDNIMKLRIALNKLL